jgi:nucleoside-diphosphate-sugar epimerase
MTGPCRSLLRCTLFVTITIGLCTALLTMSSTASTSTNILREKAILVIGGTGRVGRAVVPKLIKEGFSVRVLCRNLSQAKNLTELTGAVLFEGDVCNLDSIITASVDCSAVVDVHGMRPARFSKITDLFTHPRNIPSHPYNINYLGVKKVLAAMEINKVSKIVRITGALVDKSAFIPVRILFNFLLSMTTRWHEASEICIRNSGFDYTVIRPTEIVNEPRVVRMSSRAVRCIAV